METPFVLSVALEKALRRKVRNAVALRAILLSRQRLGKRIHDLQGFYRSDPTGYSTLTRNDGFPTVTSLMWSMFSTCPVARLRKLQTCATLTRASLAQISKAFFPRCSRKPLGKHLSLDSSGECASNSGWD